MAINLVGTTVILIRHADRTNQDPSLNTEGQERAETLVHVLGISGIDHVTDLHFPPLCAMLLTASEGERHGTHFRAVSPLSQRPGHQRR